MRSWSLDAEIKEKSEIINRLAEEIGSGDTEMARLRVVLETDGLRILSRRRALLRDELSQLVANQMAVQLASNGSESKAARCAGGVKRLLEKDPLYAEAKQQLASIQQAIELIRETSRTPPYTSTADLFQEELESYSTDNFSDAKKNWHPSSNTN